MKTIWHILMFVVVFVWVVVAVLLAIRAAAYLFCKFIQIQIWVLNKLGSMVAWLNRPNTLSS